MSYSKRERKVYGMKDYLDFGQYRGQTVEEVCAKDPKYLVWALENVSYFDMDKASERIVLECAKDD